MDINKRLLTNQHLFRSFAIFGIVFFLITMIFTAFVIVPKINSVFESQHSKDIQVDLALEAQLFMRFVESQRTVLQDLASFPSLVNAAMLSDGNNPALIDLFDNVVISGDAGRVVLQDISGKIVMQSTQALQGSYSEGEVWIEQVLNGDIPFHFYLLSQEGDSFTFKISIPVNYNTYIEGVLSAEITAPLDHLFIAQSFDEHIAFKLVQDHIAIATDSSHIGIVRETAAMLEGPNVTLIYVTDDALVDAKEQALRKTILMVLLAGLAISFLLFTLFGYQTLKNKNDKVSIKPTVGRIYIIPIVVALIGTGASVTGYLIFDNLQKASLSREQIATSKVGVESIRERIRGNMEVLESVKAFFDSSTAVDRQEFNAFVTPILKNHGNIKAVAWLPNVPFSKRDEYENNAQLEGLNSYVFRELNDQRDVVVAGVRELYFPVYYAEPLLGNEKAFGFDLASNSKRLAALTKASDTGSKVATSPVKLIDKASTETGVLIFYPVYSKTQKTQKKSMDSVIGFVQLVLRSDALIGDMLEKTNGLQSFHVQDVTNTGNAEEIFGTQIVADQIVLSETIDVAGRLWQINTAAITEKRSLHWASLLVLVSGLISVGLISAGLIYLIRRREVVEAIVEERTAELRMLSSIVANSNDLFIVTEANELDKDMGGLKIVYVNDAFTRLTGYSYEEAVGKSPHFLQGEDTERKQLDEIRAALEQGTSYAGELLNYTKDNKEYWVELNIAPLKNDAGEIIQFASVQRDVTERKLAQVEREKLISELTDSNEELERFAYVCSHDLQEPLRMIGSFSEKLQLHIAGDLDHDEKGKKYFRFITDGAARAQSLIADILTYSSISNDTHSLQRINGLDLIDSIKGVMREALLEGGVQITHDELPELQGNKTQLYQLFQNLINNAIKYQHPDTRPHVHIGVVDAGKIWQFSVKDNGIGMEERHLDKIFDVFQRLHRKSQFAGTGIGLSICKKVVSRHGGTLWVESELGIGSTFHFTLLKSIPIKADHNEHRKAS